MSQQSKYFAMAVWAITLFSSFLFILIVFLLKLGDSTVQKQVRESLNWSITMFIFWIPAVVLSMIFGGWIWSIAALINMITCILGIVACYNGDDYQAPFAIRLIK